MVNPIDFVIHIDKYLQIIIQNYGLLTYLILFLIIFAETGFVITPFLPGDSMIFVAATLAAGGAINIVLLFFILASAAILGDTVNYWLGHHFREKIFKSSRFFRKDYLDKTKEFYKKHGGKTIILARFVPIVRTFAPFVAGIGSMEYVKFLAFNVVGAIIWVALFTFGGYYFGMMPFIKQNLTIVIFIIVFLSLVPSYIEFLKSRKH